MTAQCSKMIILFHIKSHFEPIRKLGNKNVFKKQNHLYPITITMDLNSRQLRTARKLRKSFWKLTIFSLMNKIVNDILVQ